MIYPVLGFHKSGTSMLAETLHESGIPMAGKTADLDHKFEDKIPKAITKDVLGIPPSANNHSLLLARTFGAEHHIQSAKSYILDRNKAKDWGFKFPSTLLCWTEFWMPALESIAPRQVRPIGIFRSPFWVWRHYHSRQNAPNTRIFEAWTHYNELLLHLHHIDGVPLLQYGDFFYDGPRKFLQFYTGIELKDCFVQKQRSLPKGIVEEYRQAVPDRVEQLYCELIEQKEDL